MGRYRNLAQQLDQLQELQGIITSMKTMSQLELHKLAGLAAERREMVQTLARVAGDFLQFHPQPAAEAGAELWLVVGSERGFCGDFNAALLKQLLRECPACRAQPQRVLAVGRKLWARMEEALPGSVPLAGASVSEELPHILAQVVGETQRQLARQQLAGVRLISHSGERGEVANTRLLPPELRGGQPALTTPPLLQLTPARFFAEFLQHYLHLTLTELFSRSLQSENHYRVAHLEGAVRRLDERLAELGSRARTLRQEEITEEIETILLGAGVLPPQGAG